MAMRTIVIPVAEVLEGGTKQEFYQCLRSALADAVRVSKLVMNHCVRQDDWSKEKIDKIYTYPDVKHLIPGSSNAVSSIVSDVQGLYYKKRNAVIGGYSVLPSPRSVPWPLNHNKSKRHLILSDEGEFLKARLKIRDKWWVVRLAGGSNYRRQVWRIKKAIEAGSYGDSSIWIRKDGEDRKVAVIGVACKIEPKSVELDGELTITSAIESLLKLTVAGSDTPYVINADEARQWVAWADIKMQRLRQDRKSGINRKRLQEDIDRVSRKNLARFRTLCHTIASTVVKRASRLKLKTIVLDFTVKTYIKHFPWYQLESMIKYKAADKGMDVVVRTMAVKEPKVNEPHIYFKYSPITKNVKIGKTQRTDGGRHGVETDSPDPNLVILAIDNQPKAKLTAREKHFHALFAEHRIKKDTGTKTEWFKGDKVIEWLRAAKWLANAGNLSQIQQYMDVTDVASIDGCLRANGESPSDLIADGCSQKANKCQGYFDESQTAPEVTEPWFGY